MDLLKTAFNFASNAAQTYYQNYSKQQKLRENLKNCTYSDDVKLIIEKAVKQVYNVYPNFSATILQFYQKGQLKRFVELKSNLDIEIRGTKHQIDYLMMLPVNFPKKPPFVRIINTNKQQVNPFYQSLRSPTDPTSFILNQKLTQCKNWDQSKSIVNVIIQSQNMLRQNFPFSSYNPNWAAQNQNQNNYNNQQYNQYANYGNNNSNYGFTNQQTGNNKNTNLYPNLNSNANLNANKRPPIPFSTSNPAQSIKKSQQFISQSKKLFDKLKKQHHRTVENLQYLQTLKHSMQSQQEYLRHENIKMNNFLRTSEKSSIRDINSLIRPRDDRSEQVLDLLAGLRAQQDCLHMVEAKFNEGNIGYEQFIRMARKIEQDKFQHKFILAKCMDRNK